MYNNISLNNYVSSKNLSKFAHGFKRRRKYSVALVSGEKHEPSAAAERI